MLLLAIGLLVLVVAVAVGVFLHTAALHDALQDSLERLEGAVRVEDWQRARRELNHLEELWGKADSFWSPIMDHNAVDRVDEAVIRIVHLTRQEMREELLVETGVASRLVARLKDKELPGIGTVF